MFTFQVGNLFFFFFFFFAEGGHLKSSAKEERLISFNIIYTLVCCAHCGTSAERLLVQTICETRSGQAIQ